MENIVRHSEDCRKRILGKWNKGILRTRNNDRSTRWNKNSLEDGAGLLDDEVEGDLKVIKFGRNLSWKFILLLLLLGLLLFST
jgi:hypothetical protein